MAEATAQKTTKLLLVSEDLWRRLKIVAAEDGTSVREITERAVARELERIDRKRAAGG